MGEGVGVGAEGRSAIVGWRVRATSSFNDGANCTAARRRPSTLSDPRPPRTGSTGLGSFPARWSIFLRMSSASFRFPARSGLRENQRRDGVAATRSREDATFMILKFGNVRKQTLSQHRRSGRRTRKAAPTKATLRFSRCL